MDTKLTVCPNCGQWQHPVKDARVADCLHECRKRGFAPMPERQEPTPSK